MKSMTFLIGFLCGSLALTSPCSAQDLTRPQQHVLAKGLNWLVKAQHKDGHWEGNNGNYPVALTALAGMALLAEGSTPFEGAFSEELERTVFWLIERARKNGRLGEGQHYMHCHGFALLFLANVHESCAPKKGLAKPQDADRQEMLRKIRAKGLRKDLDVLLKKAVDFSVAAQNHRGGWFYVAAAESGDSDEMNVTALQLHALEAARQVGIAVPAASLDRARRFLEMAIPVYGPNTYDPKPLKKQPLAVAAALAAEFSAGNFDSALVKKWLPYCPADAGGFNVIDLESYFHFHYAQVMYGLGDKGYANLVPMSEKPATWTAYRQALWTRATELQNKDGSWNHQVGNVYATATYLTALQIENGRVPFFRRGKWVP